MAEKCIAFAGYCPHPPIVVPEVGQAEAKKVKETAMAMEGLFSDLKDKQELDALVMITPHGPVFHDAIAVLCEEELMGDLSSFRAPEVNFKVNNNLSLAKELIKIAEKKGILTAQVDQKLATSFNLSTKLDHGITVPLYFLQKSLGKIPPIVPISIGLLPYTDLYRFGMAITEAAGALGIKIGIVASGDLSHKLTEDAPGGYSPAGNTFDTAIQQIWEQGSALDLSQLESDLVSEAGECGLRPLYILLGAVDGFTVRTEKLSYQAPFGVGYMVGRMEVLNEDREKKLYNKLIGLKEENMEKVRAEESVPVKIARTVLENSVRKGKKLTFVPKDVEEPFDKPAGAFVSIKKGGQLRGCIGTIQPTRENVAEEIVANALEAGFEDPRFNQVEAEELDQLTYSVDILGDPEPVESEAELDPKRYGVIVTSGNKKGVLLPNLHGVDSVSQQLEIAREKAGIGANEPMELQRFLVTRYH